MKKKCSDEVFLVTFIMLIEVLFFRYKLYIIIFLFIKQLIIDDIIHHYKSQKKTIFGTISRYI